jgi:hypothetical protein
MRDSHLDDAAEVAELGASHSANLSPHESQIAYILRLDASLSRRNYHNQREFWDWSYA